MKSVSILKILLYLIPILSMVLRTVESISVLVSNKPLFVHFYLVQKKLPKNKKEFLIDNISFYKKLSPSRKRYFEHRLVMFLRNYDFVSRGGFGLTPESKILIASSYVKLTFGMRRFIINTFDKIIIYPNVYFSNITKEYHKGEFNPRLKALIFSWEDFLLGEIITNDNLNLGIHEFTHAITFHSHKSSDTSAKVFSKVYKRILIDLKNENQLTKIKELSIFRDYAFNNDIEFIAVVLEVFFESPKELKEGCPLLYDRVLKMLNYKWILN